MVDFRVDDGLPWHPKTLGISLEAIGLWTYAGCWCARYLTDGYIPSEAMATLTRKHQPLAELIRHNMIQEIEGGYLFRDWLDYQRSAQEVRKDRARNAERQARFRARRDGTKPDP